MHHLVYRTWSRSFWPAKRWDKILTPFKPSKSKVQAARLAKYGTTLARIIFRGDDVRASSGGAGVSPPTIQSICKHCRIIRDVENPESAGGGLYEGLPSASSNAVDGGGHLCSVTSRIMAGGVRGKVATSNPLWIWTKSVWPSFWLQCFGICAFGRCWLLVCVCGCVRWRCFVRRLIKKSSENAWTVSWNVMKLKIFLKGSSWFKSLGDTITLKEMHVFWASDCAQALDLYEPVCGDRSVSTLSEGMLTDADHEPFVKKVTKPLLSMKLLQPLLLLFLNWIPRWLDRVRTLISNCSGWFAICRVPRVCALVRWW